MANSSGIIEMRKMLMDKFGGKHYLTIPEVAPLFGCGKTALYKSIREGVIPLPIRRKTNNHIRITLGDLLDFFYPLETAGTGTIGNGELVERRKVGRPRRSTQISK